MKAQAQWSVHLHVDASDWALGNRLSAQEVEIIGKS